MRGADQSGPGARPEHVRHARRPKGPRSSSGVRRDHFTDSGRCVYAGSDTSTYTFSKIDIRARDLATLVAGLKPGVPPACSRGNEEKDSFFSIFNVSGDSPYDGPVVYHGRREPPSNGSECFSFDTPGLPAQGYGPPDLEVCAPLGLLAEPTVGEALWVRLEPLRFGTLRRGQHGPLLLASASGNDGFDEVAIRIGATLGVNVEARKGCAYANDVAAKATYFLTDLVFAATPPVVVTGDSRAVITLDGRELDVWMAWDSGAVTVAPR